MSDTSLSDACLNGRVRFASPQTTVCGERVVLVLLLNSSQRWYYYYHVDDPKSSVRESDGVGRCGNWQHERVRRRHAGRQQHVQHVDLVCRLHAHTRSSVFSTATQPVPERLNQSGFYWSKRQWVAVASAGPYASLHLAPDRQPCQHPTTQFFYRPDALPVAQPTVSKHWRQLALTTRCPNKNVHLLFCEYFIQKSDNFYNVWITRMADTFRNFCSFSCLKFQLKPG